MYWYRTALVGTWQYWVAMRQYLMLLGQWRASMPLHIETVEIPNSQTDRLWKIGLLYLNSLYCWSLALVYVFSWTEVPKSKVKCISLINMLECEELKRDIRLLHGWIWSGHEWSWKEIPLNIRGGRKCRERGGAGIYILSLGSSWFISFLLLILTITFSHSNFLLTKILLMVVSLLSLLPIKWHWEGAVYWQRKDGPK